MILSSKEAKELMPRAYISNEELFVKIRDIAKSGLDYIWTDLTQGQKLEFEKLGYEVEDNSYERKYKISWKRGLAKID